MKPLSEDQPLSGELRPLVRLALPIAAVNLGQQMMAVVDTAMAGRIDELSLAATGLGNSVFMAGAIFAIGVAIGVDPVASQAFGAGKHYRARRSMWQGVYAGLLVTVPVGLFIWLVASWLEAIGIAPALAAETRLYVFARLGSLVPLVAMNSVRSYLQAAHLTRAIVISAVLANLFNLVADWVLIFGDSGLVRLGLPAVGLPAMGVEGIGWATTAASAGQLTVMALAVRHVLPGQRRRRKAAAAFDAPLMRLIATLGIPIGFQLFAEIGIFSVVALMAGRMGTLAMAAHQTALILAAFTFMIPLAIGTATSVQVGRAIGRGDSQATRQAGLAGILLGGLVMLFAAITMWTFPRGLARLMTDDEPVVQMAAELIAIAGAFQIFDGIQAVASGALRGAGLTRWAMVANVAAYWIVGLPVAYWLGYQAGMGPHGLWWGLTVGLAAAAAALAVKFYRVSRRPIAALDSRPD